MILEISKLKVKAIDQRIWFLYRRLIHSSGRLISVLVYLTNTNGIPEVEKTIGNHRLFLLTQLTT
jgi:hypothetical protein